MQRFVRDATSVLITAARGKNKVTRVTLFITGDRVSVKRGELTFGRNRICLWGNKQYFVAIRVLCNRGVTLRLLWRLPRRITAWQRWWVTRIRVGRKNIDSQAFGRKELGFGRMSFVRQREDSLESLPFSPQGVAPRTPALVQPLLENLAIQEAYRDNSENVKITNCRK